MPLRWQWLETSLISCSVLLPPWSGCWKKGPLCHISPRISLPQLQGDRTQDEGSGGGGGGRNWQEPRVGCGCMRDGKLPLSSIVL